jgi:hypothetical protein
LGDAMQVRGRQPDILANHPAEPREDGRACARRAPRRPARRTVRARRRPREISFGAVMSS